MNSPTEVLKNLGLSKRALLDLIEEVYPENTSESDCRLCGEKIVYQEKSEHHFSVAKCPKCYCIWVMLDFHLRSKRQFDDKFMALRGKRGGEIDDAIEVRFPTYMKTLELRSKDVVRIEFATHEGLQMPAARSNNKLVNLLKKSLPITNEIKAELVAYNKGKKGTKVGLNETNVTSIYLYKSHYQELYENDKEYKELASTVEKINKLNGIFTRFSNNNDDIDNEAAETLFNILIGNDKVLTPKAIFYVRLTNVNLNLPIKFQSAKLDAPKLFEHIASCI